MNLRILHTNDFHGSLDEALVERLLPMRGESDLYFDTGDLIKAGNLAIPLKPDPAWPLLKKLNCSASTLGNRESQPLEGAFKKKIAGLAHPVVCANLKDKAGMQVFPPSLLLEANGVRVGVIGAMVPIVTERMATAAVSHYLWSAPIPAVVAVAHGLRPLVDALFALTHIGYAQDKLLAEACPQLDMIFGGHSHTVLQTPDRVNGVWIAQGGSHGRFVGKYEFDVDSKELSGALIPLK